MLENNMFCHLFTKGSLCLKKDSSDYKKKLERDDYLKNSGLNCSLWVFYGIAVNLFLFLLFSISSQQSFFFT